MIVKKFFHWTLVLTVALVLATSFIVTGYAAPVFAENSNPHLLKTFIDSKGRPIDMIEVPGKPPEFRQKESPAPDPISDTTSVTLVDVPAFDWSYGCSATSAAMLFGYYDRTGYPDMYTGPDNGGVCPLNNADWGHTTYPSVTCGETPISATHNGMDGLTGNGHVDDYWVDYGDYGNDPIGNGTPHVDNCTADFMGTNQDKWRNSDGSTIFLFNSLGFPLYDYTGGESSDYRDGCHGMRLFAESRGYTVVTNYSQYIRGYLGLRNGFTFTNYMAEINAGRPVLIQVSGHTMVGFGYDTVNNTVYVRNTWDYGYGTMTWGGSYSGMRQYGVTVFQLASPQPAAPVANFTADQLSGTAPLTVKFTDQSTSTPTSWAWDFNNDGTRDSTVQNPSWTYATAGTYSVKLVVANAAGTDDEIKTDYIAVNPEITVTPEAAFIGSPTSGTAPLTVNFTDQSTNAPTSWAWDFDGDNDIDSTVQNPSYTYTTAGTYTVMLTATNNAGSNSETENDYITVNPAPPASITVTSPNGGEIWEIGSRQKINWSSLDIAGKVRIELSINGGGTWATISSNAPNNGVYNWKVTRTPSTSAIIKVSSIDNPTASDTSDNCFTIQ